MATQGRREREAAIAILASALSHVQETDARALPTRRDLRGLVDDLHVEIGDFARVWRDAILDGKVDAEEARRALLEARDMRRALDDLSDALLKIARED